LFKIIGTNFFYRPFERIYCSLYSLGHGILNPLSTIETSPNTPKLGCTGYAKGSDSHCIDSLEPSEMAFDTRAHIVLEKARLKGDVFESNEWQAHIRLRFFGSL